MHNRSRGRSGQGGWSSWKMRAGTQSDRVQPQGHPGPWPLGEDQTPLPGKAQTLLSSLRYLHIRPPSSPNSELCAWLGPVSPTFPITGCSQGSPHSHPILSGDHVLWPCKQSATAGLWCLAV